MQQQMLIEIFYMFYLKMVWFNRFILLLQFSEPSGIIEAENGDDLSHSYNLYRSISF